MSRGMWKIVEASSGEIGLGETEGEGEKRGGRKEMRRVGEAEIEGEEDSGGEESGRGMGDLG